SPNKVAALLLETLDRDAVVPVVGCLSSDPASDRTPIGRHSRVPGKPRNATTLGQHVVRPDHHLGWDAAVIGALAAHQVAFDADHLETDFGEAFSDFLAAHTRAENDGVDLFSHFAWRRWSWPVEPPPQPPPAPDRESGLASGLDVPHLERHETGGMEGPAEADTIVDGSEDSVGFFERYFGRWVLTVEVVTIAESP